MLLSLLHLCHIWGFATSSPGRGVVYPGSPLSQRVLDRFLLTALPRVSLLVLPFPALLLNVVTSGPLGMPRGRLWWLLLLVHAGQLSCAVHCQVCVTLLTWLLQPLLSSVCSVCSVFGSIPFSFVMFCLSIGLGGAGVALIGCTAVFSGAHQFLTVGSPQFCTVAVTADFNVY